MLDLSVRAEPAVLHEIRRTVRGLADQLGIDRERAQDLQVAVGEALSNAIAHAYLSGPGMIHLRARRHGAVLVVEVEDHGRWRTRRFNSRGYGLRLMRTLMDSVSVNTTANGTTVRLTLALPNGPRGRRSL